MYRELDSKELIDADALLKVWEQLKSNDELSLGEALIVATKGKIMQNPVFKRLWTGKDNRKRPIKGIVHFSLFREN